MKPIRLTARDYRSFADLDYAFVDGATAVTGSNGAGKSTLIGAVEVALFGPRSRSLEPLVREGSDDMQVTLEFGHVGELYRVRRGWKSGRSTLDLERWRPEEWIQEMERLETREKISDGQFESLTQGNAADTQLLIEQTIGLTRTTFNASGYLAQRQSDSFTGAQPKDRKRILSDALALDAWQTDAERVGADRRTFEKQLAEISAKVDGLADRAAAADSLTTEAGDLLVLVDVETLAANEARGTAETEAARAAGLDAGETAWKVASANAAAARAANSAHLEQLKRTTAAKDQLHIERTNLAAIGQWENADDLEVQERTLLAAHEAYRLAKQERHTALQAQDDLGQRSLAAEREGLAIRGKAQQVIDLIGHSQHCETCGQTLGEEAARTAYSTYLSQAAALEETAWTLAEQGHAIAVPDAGLEPDPQDIHDLRRRIEGARGHATRALQTTTKIEGLERIVAETSTDEYRETARRLSFELVEAEQALSAIAQPEAGAADHARAAALQAKAAAEAHASRARTASERLAAVTALLEQAQAAAAEHAAAVAERDRLHTELDILVRLEQAFGKDGIPAWIVESRAIPVIEVEANRILSRLGGSISRVEMRTEKTTKSGDLRDALEIACHADSGYDRPYDQISGGEKTRVEIAFARGFARLLGANNGADLRFFALDEPAGLDDQGTESLASAVSDLANSEEIVVMVITHDRLADCFDQSVLVQRGPRGSEVIA